VNTVLSDAGDNDMAHDLHETEREPRSTAKGCSPQSFICQGPEFIDPVRRHAMIAEAAYYRAERRGFTPGYELRDWLEARDQIDAALTVDERHRLYGDNQAVD
jgi:hypothetical protein